MGVLLPSEKDKSLQDESAEESETNPSNSESRQRYSDEAANSGKEISKKVRKPEYDDTVAKKADRTTTYKVALVSAVGAIVVAVISGAVSWIVAGQTLAQQDIVQRATLFKELINEVNDENGGGYATLALWKLYPEDRRLVIISALQSDKPQPIAVLMLLGLEDELDDYESTIRNAINNTPVEKRKELLKLYSQINPESLLDLNVESILAEKAHLFVQTSQFDELVELLSGSVELQKELAKKIEADSRISNDLTKEFTFALALYMNKSTDRFDKLLLKAGQDIEFFGRLARLVRDGSAVGRYTVEDQKTILKLSIKYMEHISAKEELLSEFYGALEAFETSYNNDELVSAEDQLKVLNLFEGQFRQFSDHLQRLAMLRIAARMEIARARVWYYSAISCEAEGASKKFYLLSRKSAQGFLFDNVDLGEFAVARANGAKYLEEQGAPCKRWKA